MGFVDLLSDYSKDLKKDYAKENYFDIFVALNLLKIALAMELELIERKIKLGAE